MSNIAPVKLSTIKAKANETFANLPVEISDGDVVFLRNALQLTDEEREVLSTVQDEPEVEDGQEPAKRKSQLEVLRGIIRCVTGDEDGTHDPEGAERLIEAVGDNLAFLVELFKTYNDGTQVGEA